MARLVCGIDVGNGAVRAAVVRFALRGAEVAGLFEAPLRLPEDGGAPEPDAVKEALAALAARLPPGLEERCAALPGDQATVRVLSFPRAALRQADAAIRVELEGQIPFEASEAVFDHVVVSPAAEDPAAVLVVLARLEALRAFTSLLGSAGLDPGLVGIGALPLARLLPRGDKGQPPAALCLVDVGRLVTDLVVVRGGSPVFLRSFRAGAEEITRAIARALNVPRAQAEALKVGQLGFPDPAAISFTPPPDGALLAAAETGLGALLAPLRRTLLELRGRAVLGNDPLRILLTGGGSRIPGLAAAVAARLVVPVERLADAPLRVRGVPPEAVPAFGRAIGIALDHAAPRSQRVDLRKGEVRYRGDTAALRSRARVVAAGLGLVFFAWVFSAWAHDRALDAEAGRQRAALERATTAVMGRKYSDFDAVRSLLGKSSKPAEGPLPKADVLDILADLARSVPAEIRHSLTSLTIQPGKLEMNGLTRNAEEAARIPKMLKPDRSRETDRSKGPSPLEECVRDVGTLSGSGSEGNYTYQIEATTVCP